MTEKLGNDRHQFPIGKWSHITPTKVNVAGVSHHMGAVRQFVRDVRWCEARKKIYGLRIERERNNQFDKNALKVIGFSERKSFFGLGSTRQLHVGYVPAALAKELVEDYYDQDKPIGCEMYSVYIDRSGFIDISFFPLREPVRRKSFKRKQPK